MDKGEAVNDPLIVVSDAVDQRVARVAARYVASLADHAGPAPEIFADEVDLWWNIRPEGQRMAGAKFANALAEGHPPEHMADYRLDITMVREMTTGFVVTLAVRGTTPAGVAVEANVCQIVTVHDGLITRWEEFLDQGQHQPFHG
jgi:ketosteroid isomerase-like protein